MSRDKLTPFKVCSLLQKCRQIEYNWEILGQVSCLCPWDIGFGSRVFRPQVLGHEQHLIDPYVACSSISGLRRQGLCVLSRHLLLVHFLWFDQYRRRLMPGFL